MADTSDLPSHFYCTKPIDFSKTVDTSNLKDKSVIVTGGARGLGAGCVTSFAKAGAYVTILDINEELGNAHATSLSKEGYHVQFVKADTTSFASQTVGFKSAISFSPRSTIDIVLTSAGVAGKDAQSWLEEASQTPDADPPTPRTTIIDVNLIGLYYSTHLALHYFKQTSKPGDDGSKHLIYISSLAGYIPINGLLDYNASKFGVRGMFKALRHNDTILGDDRPRFRLNLVAPTFIRTAMTNHAEPELAAIGIKFGEVEDVVAGVVRLACDESISGRAIAIAAGKDEAGDRNFDLNDDWEGLDAGKAMLEKSKDGTVRGLELIGPGPHHQKKADEGN